MASMESAFPAFLAQHVAGGTVPGVVGTLGSDYHPVAVGRDAPDGEPLRPDALFRIQSMTKPITAVAALRLVQQGVLELDDPIARWLPELDEPRVLDHPQAPLSHSRPAKHPITLRHLLTNQSGYGVLIDPSPLQRAMDDSGLRASSAPPDRGAQEWLDSLAALPLAFEPGTGWRYHHSFGLLGILLHRLTSGGIDELLQQTVYTPAGMRDTGFSIPADKAHRLPAAFRRSVSGFEQTEPASAGYYVEPVPFDTSHSELVSTLADYYAFLNALLNGKLLDLDLLNEMRCDQVGDEAKTPESFYPGFWDDAGWGYGVCVLRHGPHAGRFGWSGGLGTDFYVDPDGTICIIMTQVEMDAQIMSFLDAAQEIH